MWSRYLPSPGSRGQAAEGRMGFFTYKASKIAAAPIPVPIHIVTIP